MRAGDVPKCTGKYLFRGTAVKFYQNRMRFDIYSENHFDNISASLTTTPPQLLRTIHRMWLSVHHFTAGPKK